MYTQDISLIWVNEAYTQESVQKPAPLFSTHGDFYYY